MNKVYYYSNSTKEIKVITEKDQIDPTGGCSVCHGKMLDCPICHGYSNKYSNAKWFPIYKWFKLKLKKWRKNDK